MNVVILKDGNKHTGPNTWAKDLSDGLRLAGVEVSEVDVTALYSAEDLRALAEAQIVHGYHVSGLSLPTLAVMKLLKRPIVFTLHGDYIAEAGDKRGLKRLLWKPFFELSIKLADLVTIPSLFLKEKVIKYLPRRKNTQVIHNGVFLQNVVEAEPTAKLQPRNLLTVTQFTLEDKARGVVPLIAAVEELSSEFQDLTLTIIGGGGYLDNLKDRYAHSRTTKFLGRLPHSEVLKKTSECDIFLYSSFLDNMPYAVLEAMSFGRPVIATRVGGLAEVLGAQCLVEPTISSIKQRLRAFLRDYKVRDAAAGQARKEAENLAFPVIAKEFESAYESLCGKLRAEEAQ